MATGTKEVKTTFTIKVNDREFELLIRALGYYHTQCLNHDVKEEINCLVGDFTQIKIRSEG
jgi:hypothetical protein